MLLKILTGANLDQKGSTKNITFSRRYLDPNRVTYEVRGVGRECGNVAASDSLRSTTLVVRIQRSILCRVNLSRRASTTSPSSSRSACSTVQPRTTSRSPGTSSSLPLLPLLIQSPGISAPYPSNDSLLSLFAEALTYSLTVNNTRADVPHIMIATAGSQRFDIYAGPFTKNDQLTASPFANFFSYIPNIPLAVARQVLPKMNGAATLGRRREQDEERYSRGDVDVQYRAWLAEMGRRASAERRDTENATLGYVTSDVRRSFFFLSVSC